MQNRRPAEPDAEVLPELMAARLLERAGELDAVRAGSSAISDLRAAAAEAGISASAFDAALAEMQESKNAPVDGQGRPRRRTRMWAIGAAVAALIAIGALRLFPTAAPAPVAAVPGAPIVEESILLRCLSPGEAAELIRPLLRLPSNTIVVSPAQAPRVLTVRATPEQLQNVKSLLEKSEGAGSTACAPRPKATVTP